MRMKWELCEDLMRMKWELCEDLMRMKWELCEYLRYKDKGSYVVNEHLPEIFPLCVKHLGELRRRYDGEELTEDKTYFFSSVLFSDKQ